MRCRLAVLSFLVLAAPASAKTIIMGSDLKASATQSVSNPQDWAAWNTGLPGRKFRVPAEGELNEVRIKGRALQAYSPPVSVNVQVLHPQGHGKVQATVTSQSLPMPTSGDDNQITTFDRTALDLVNTRMCVEKGDYVSFFVNGGAEVRPEGLQLQVFAKHPGATATVFKTKTGQAPPSKYKGHPKRGQELLMQMRIGTGVDARYFCQTKYQQQHGGRSPGRARAVLL